MVDVKHVFTGRVIEVNVERVQLPNGAVADLEIIHHPGGAAVVALDDDNRICLLRQFRHAVDGWIWELPAGKIDNREPPLDTAQRELEEEAGMAAALWRSLGDYVSSPGVFTEVVHLFLATAADAAAAATRRARGLRGALAAVRRTSLRDGATPASCATASRSWAFSGPLRTCPAPATSRHASPLSMALTAVLRQPGTSSHFRALLRAA